MPKRIVRQVVRVGMVWFLTPYARVVIVCAGGNEPLEFRPGTMYSWSAAIPARSRLKPELQRLISARSRYNRRVAGDVHCLDPLRCVDMAPHAFKARIA